VQQRADGSTYPVEINLQLLTSEGKNECLAIVNDITALKQAEEDVRKFNAPVERRGSGR
jgi:PAS domain S-box-containing protein